MRTQAQKAAYIARLFSEDMARLRKQAVPVPRISPLTGKPLMAEMARQAAREETTLDSMLSLS